MVPGYRRLPPPRQLTSPHPTSTNAQAALKEITRLKLPLPLVFQVHNDRAAGTVAVPDRAGVRRPAVSGTHV
jgi:hypothetical protein